MKKIQIVLLAAVAFVSLAFAPAFSQAALKVGDVVPEYSIDMEGGTKVNLAELAKKHNTIVIAFLQTACTACRGEIVELNAVSSGGRSKKAFVLPIIVDMRGGAEFLASYKAEYSIELKFGLDPKFAVPRLFGMSFTPGSVVIKDGKVAELIFGYDDAIKTKLTQIFN